MEIKKTRSLYVNMNLDLVIFNPTSYLNLIGYLPPVSNGR